MRIKLGDLVACKVKDEINDRTYFALGMIKSNHSNKFYTVEWLDKDNAVSHTSRETTIELKNLLKAIMDGKTNGL